MDKAVAVRIAGRRDWGDAIARGLVAPEAENEILRLQEELAGTKKENARLRDKLNLVEQRVEWFRERMTIAYRASKPELIPRWAQITLAALLGGFLIMILDIVTEVHM